MAYIAFDGPDGTGKSTQAALLAVAIDARLTREPGATAIGQRVRSIVLDGSHDRMAPTTEALLMAADRLQHMEETVRPTIASGRHLVSDRSVFSTLAFQGGGRLIGEGWLKAINCWGSSLILPDLVVMLTASPDILKERLSGKQLDRIELADDSFRERVEQKFWELANNNSRFIVIDTSMRSIDLVASDVRSAVSTRFSV